MALRSALSSLRAMAAESGASIACLYLLHRLLLALRLGRVVPYALVAQPIGADVYRATRDDPSTLVRRVGAEDPMALRFPRPPQVNAARWAAGADCHVCEVKNDFAGTIWIQRGAYDEDEVRCRFELVAPETSVWDFDVYVEPRYRVGRTMARMWKAVDRELAAQGIRWSFSRISLFNGASLRAHARLAAVIVGRAIFVQIGPLQLAWCKGTGPAWHASLPGSTGPTVRLDAPAPRPQVNPK